MRNKRDIAPAEPTARSAADAGGLDRLRRRPSRPPDFQAENAMLRALADELAERPGNLLQKLCDVLVEGGVGGSAGISLRGDVDGADGFRWVALAGAWSRYKGGAMPFDESPCGVVIREDAALLIEHPERRFPRAALDPLIHEGLLVPFHSAGEPVGTLWVSAHDDRRLFDAEDLRLLESLARFAAAGFRTADALNRARADERAGRNALAADLAGLHRLHELYARLASETDLDTALRDILAAALDLAGTDRGVVQRVSADGERLEFAAHLGYGEGTRFTEHFRFEGSKAACDSARRHHQRMIIEDIAAFPALAGTVDREIALAEDIRATLSVPMVSRTGELIGVLNTQFRTPHHPSDRDLRLMDMLAWTAAGFIERHGSVSAMLARSEERWRGLFERMHEGFALCEMVYDASGEPVDYRVLETNAAWGRMIGQPHEELKGRLVTDVVPGIEPFWIETYGRVARTGVPAHFEHEVAAVGRWFDVMSYQTEPDHFAVLFHDSTERRAAERRQRFLLRLSDALRPLADPAVIRSEACRLLGEHLEADWVVYGRIDAARDVVDISRGFTPDDLPPITGEQPLSAFAWALPSYEAGVTVVVGDAQASDRIPVGERPAMAALRMAALISVPLLKEGKLVGALAVSQATPRSWTEAEIRLAEETAERIWASIERGRVERALKMSEERQSFLLGLSDTLRSMIDPEDIIAAASEALGRYLGAGQVAFAEGELSSGQVDIKREWNDGSVPSNAGRHRLDEFGPAFVADFDRGLSVAIDDVTLDPRTSTPQASATFSRVSIRSFLDIPLMRRGGVVAVLAVHDSLPRVWRPEDVAMAEEVAERIWVAVERARAETALRKSEEKFRSALDIETVGVLFWGPDFRLTQANPSFLGTTGFSREEAIGLSWQELTPPEFHPASLRAVAQIETTGRAVPYEKQYYRKDGSRWWGLFAPRRLADGEVVEFVLDIDDQHRQHEALRESEERLRSFAETSTDTLWIADADTGRLEYLSPAYEAIWGEPRDAVVADSGHWATRVHPDDFERVADTLGRLKADGRHAIEYRIVRPDGEVRYIFDTGFAITEHGRVRRLAGVAQDLTERRLAERALAESERRARTLIEGVPQLVWRAVGEGEWTWASPQWTDYTGQPEPESHGFGWLDAVHPDDREQVQAAWNGATARGEFQADYRLRHAAEGRHRWFQSRATPLRDDGGHIVEWLGTSTDVDDLRQLQERQQLLVAELQHRVRNMLTVVRSVFSRTVEAEGPIEEIADHFRGRLDALARTQVIVTQTSTGLVDLENLVRDELLSVGVSDGPSLVIEGPDVMLPPKTAESIGLALHELTTNAVKYGALKVRGATLDIRWSVDADPDGARRLDVRWTERGVPTVPVNPTREGFGRELIEEALPYQLGAKTKLEFRGGGVRCSISMPLPEEGAFAAKLLESP
jgi:PAS domain S-box-containing protein